MGIVANVIGAHVTIGRVSDLQDPSAWLLDWAGGRQTSSGERVQFTTNFLWMCQGYYRHSKGHTPDWPGMDDYSGEIIHLQTWPDDADMARRRRHGRQEGDRDWQRCDRGHARSGNCR